jgi:hypothetical protein
MHRIRAFAQAQRYREVVAYGISMGGFAALRAAPLIGADRAICISGRYCWHIGRLLRNADTIGAFDPLCPCVQRGNTQFVALAPARSPNDMTALETLRRTVPDCRTILIDTDMHNLAGYFYQAGLLRLFYACLFEFWGHAVVPDLLALLDRTARQRNLAEAQRADETAALRQRLAAAEWGLREHVSRARRKVGELAWRLTKPLRGRPL